MSKLLVAGAREGGHLTVQLKHEIPHIELLSRVFACCEGGEVSAGGLTSRRVSGLLAPALRGVVGRTAPVLARLKTILFTGVPPRQLTPEFRSELCQCFLRDGRGHDSPHAGWRREAHDLSATVIPNHFTLKLGQLW